MKGGVRLAIGVGIGYLLGRTRKMKFALMVAGALSGRSLGGPQEVLQRGMSLVSSSPELSKITETVRGELLGAARDAAVTAASNRIDAFNSRLQQQAIGPEAEAEEAEDSEAQDSEAVEEKRPAERRQRHETGDGHRRETAEEELADEYPEEDTEAARSHDEDSEATRRPSRARPAASSARRRVGESTSRAPAKASGSGERKSPRRRRLRADVDTADQAPVRRTRR
ncbi:hypothetical protein AB0B25_00945 [Nocardia sp. NPDC049190]|uniref:hypothetical protein n=1 Tax=Nocardia sp. NPDC049190 TaxID=3155650 RepID=UPI0033CD7021